MHDIDFLPVEYRQQHAQRRGQWWRIGALAMFAVLLGVAALVGYQRRQRLLTDLEAIGPHCEQAARQNARLAELQAQLRLVRAEADLYTYLRCPWPRTRLLATLLGPLPDEIVFEQLQIRADASGSRASVVSSRFENKAEEEQQAKLPGAARDLKRLRSEFDPPQTVVTIAGQTSDGAALHRYLGELSKSDLFSKAQLRSIETVKSDRGPTLRFSAVVVVRPGYGQLGGPIPPHRSVLAQAGGISNTNVRPRND